MRFAVTCRQLTSTESEIEKDDGKAGDREIKQKQNCWKIEKGKKSQNHKIAIFYCTASSFSMSSYMCDNNQKIFDSIKWR